MRTLFAKAAALLVGVMALVAIVTGTVFSRGLAASFRGELDERGRSLLRTLERHQDLHLAVVLHDEAAAGRVLEEVRAADADALYLAALDARGEIIAAVGRGDAAARVRAELPHHGLDGKSPASEDDCRRFTQAVQEGSVGAGDGLDLPGAAPAGPRVAGHLVLGLDASRIGRQAAGVTVKTVITASVVLLVVFLGFFWWIARRTAEMVTFAEQLAAGDLGVTLDEDGGDELGRLAQALRRLRENTVAVVRQLREASRALRSASGEVLEGADSQISLARGQAAAVKEADAVVERLRGTFDEARVRAESVVSAAVASEESTKTGIAAVEESVSAIVQMKDQAEAMATTVVGLVEQTAKIGSIMDAMRDLAEQSGVLSLNASLEAARAGASGRGFAVVAGEVRSLAERSRRETAEVQRIVVAVHKAARASLQVVEESRQRSQFASLLAASSGEAIRRLASTLGESSAAAAQITGSARAQGDEVSRISQAMQDVVRASEEAHSGIARLREASESILRHADRMQSVVSAYRLDGSEP